MKTWYVIKCEKLIKYVSPSAKYTIEETLYSNHVVIPEYGVDVPVANDFEDLGIDSFYLITLKSPMRDFEILRVSSKPKDIEDFNKALDEYNAIKNRPNKGHKPGESIFANLILY